MKLVIVESPAKCQKIQGFLGQGWRVLATMGHLRALTHDLSAVGIENGWTPKYEWLATKSKAIQALQEAAKEAEEVYLAADADTEGEQIAYSTCLLLRQNPSTVKRITFTEITESALRRAVANPGRIDRNRVQAQEARAMLDLLIGFTLSPVLWRHVGPALSAGRCQTPALRLVMEREDQIESFQATTSWGLEMQCSEWVAHMTEELEGEEDAVNYMENVHRIPTASVVSRVVKPWSESAPPPLMTSTLQQQASALFGMNPKQTMMHAQKLYEGGHITYMRTDKAVLSEEAAQEARAWVEEHHGVAFVTKCAAKADTECAKSDAKCSTKCSTKSDAKSGSTKCAAKAQEAHEAIRPTHMEEEEAGSDADQRKLYQLIRKRTLQSVMTPARGETCTLHLRLEEDFLWASVARRTLFLGWRVLGSLAALEDEEKEELTPFDLLSGLAVGTAVPWTQIRAQPKETKARGRYTEATLIQALEAHGIGRPSTFASLLSALHEREYVVLRDVPPVLREWVHYTLSPSTWPPTKQTVQKKLGAEKRKLMPTPLGRTVGTFLQTHFHELFAYGFTAHMEAQLDAIAQGTQVGATLLQQTWDSYRERHEALMKAPLRGRQERDMGGGLKAVLSKKGPLLIQDCNGTTHFLPWPKKIAFEALTEAEAHAHVKGFQKGEWKGEVIYHRTGPHGDYFQCGAVTVPYQEEPVEATIQRLEAKSTGGTEPLWKGKEYVIRKGPYGPYILKTGLKKARFVSVPQGIGIAALTEKEVAALYRLGLESKKGKDLKRNDKK